MSDGIGTALDIVNTASSLFGGRRQRKVAKAEATANISAYEDFLASFPLYEQVKIEAAQTEGAQQLKNLLGNLGNINVAAGATGQVGRGTSASLIAQGARGEATRFAGEDLALGGEEGSYERSLDLLRRNLSAEKSQAEAQLDVWRTASEESDPFLKRAKRGIKKFFGG